VATVTRRRQRLRDLRPGWTAQGEERSILRDAVAGVTVALVLVPQSLAYAQLAGMPGEQGLFAAAVPLLAAAVFASSPYLQPGPTAITALLAFGALTSLATPGSPEYVQLGLLLALMVGVVRVAIGLLDAGIVSYLLSPPLLYGFVPASTILICASQVPLILDASAAHERVLARAGDVLAHPGNWRLESVAIALAVAAIVVGARYVNPFVPGVLIAVVGATAFSGATDYAGGVVGEIGSLTPALTLSFPWSDLGTLVPASLVIALLGFAEASSIARTYAAVERKPWNANREFVSQGVANIAAALTNGMPVGASFSRSALNRLAGARSSLSVLFTGIVVLAVLPLGFLLEHLPRAALGAIVIVAVVPLLQLGKMVEVMRWSRPQFAITATVFALTLALEPHVEWALLAGIGVAIAVHLWKELEIEVGASRHGEALELSPVGVLWFGTARRLEDTFVQLLAEHPDATRLNLRLNRLGRIDLSGALVLDAVVKDARLAGLQVQVSGAPPQARRVLGRVLDVPIATDEVPT
jgi:sulfate permease, SulP family